MTFKEFSSMARARRQAARFKDLNINRPSSGHWLITYQHLTPTGEAYERHSEFVKCDGNAAAKEKEAQLCLADLQAWLEAGYTPYGNRY